MSAQTNGAEIKGPGIMSARDWLDARFGPGYYVRTAREVDPEFPERILPGDWYPMKVAHHVLRASYAKLDGYDSFERFIEELAIENAKNDLRGIYRAFLWVASPRMFLRAAPTIWANYANFGTLAQTENDAGRFVTRLTEIPREYVDWLAGAWKGFLPPAIELAGGKNPTATITEREPGADGAWAITYQLTYD